jgi:hypothetical protein
MATVVVDDDKILPLSRSCGNDHDDDDGGLDGDDRSSSPVDVDNEDVRPDDHDGGRCTPRPFAPNDRDDNNGECDRGGRGDGDVERGGSGNDADDDGFIFPIVFAEAGGSSTFIDVDVVVVVVVDDIIDVDKDDDGGSTGLCGGCGRCCCCHCHCCRLCLSPIMTISRTILASFLTPNMLESPPPASLILGR